MKQAVLLVAHGTPDSPADVPQFLHNVTGGRAVSAETLAEIQRRYAAIGHSPLLTMSKQQAALLHERAGLPVYLGMRNWKPYIRDVVACMLADGVTRACVICLAPQNSRTSVGLYREAVRAAAGEQLEIEFVDSWHDHPLLIRAFAERLQPVMAQAGKESRNDIAVIFTAHSVPERSLHEGDPYVEQVRETATRVARAADLKSAQWRLAFQSQGMAHGAWIGPTLEETVLRLKGEGHSAFVIHPVGFLCDHVEVLYDLDLALRDFARGQGMNFWRVESLNASPLLADALADIARSALAHNPHPRTARAEPA